MSNSTYLPIVRQPIPIATPITEEINTQNTVIQTQPQTIEASSLDDEQMQPMPIVPSQMVLCRSCNQSFLRHDGDRGSAQYYRCEKCVGLEALMMSLTFACTIS